MGLCPTSWMLGESDSSNDRLGGLEDGAPMRCVLTDHRLHMLTDRKYGNARYQR
jgi:hypothetical protein